MPPECAAEIPQIIETFGHDSHAEAMIAWVASVSERLPMRATPSYNCVSERPPGSPYSRLDAAIHW